MNSPETKVVYKNYLKNYLKFSEFTDYNQLLELSDDDTFNLLMDFVTHYRKHKKATACYVDTILRAVKLFYEVNRKQYLFWKQIKKTNGKVVRVVDDRLYTDSELKLLLEHSDLRMRTVILTLLTTGMRVGALATLKLGDITYLQDHKIYKYLCYSDDLGERYTTFCTPECANTFQIYLESRDKNGEKLSNESPYISQNDTTKKSIESFISSKSLQKALERLRYKSAVFTVEHGNVGKSRKPVPRAHSFRKMFNTICIDQNMNHSVKESLMGHKVGLGLDVHYYRPTDDKLLKEYLKVINALTISEENKLRHENTKIKMEMTEHQKLMNIILDKFQKWESQNPPSII